MSGKGIRNGSDATLGFLRCGNLQGTKLGRDQGIDFFGDALERSGVAGLRLSPVEDGDRVGKRAGEVAGGAALIAEVGARIGDGAHGLARIAGAAGGVIEEDEE